MMHLSTSKTLLGVIPLSEKKRKWIYYLVLLLFTLSFSGLNAQNVDIDFSAADPDLYDRLFPTQISPLPSGRTVGPIADTDNNTSVESLAPENMALGQVVPFLFQISPDNCSGTCLTFSAYWAIETTNGGAFGYDESYGVIAAFVDAGDSDLVDPNNNATVDNFSWQLADTDPDPDFDEIQGTFTICGAEPGETIIVEVWLVLDDQIASGTGGNVQSGLISASCANGATLNTGSQTVPLLRVGEFFSSDADVSITKTDSQDPVVQGDQLTYTIVVHNDGTLTDAAVANDVVVTDIFDPNTTFVSASIIDTEGYISDLSDLTVSGNTLTWDLQFLNPGETVTITITVDVSATAPTAGGGGAGGETCTGGPYDLLNNVTVTSITSDPNTDNNSACEPTDVEEDCDIAINSVSIVDETCPGEGDGALTVNASCTSCTTIEYSIDGVNYSDALNANIFTDLDDGTYTVYVRDSDDHSCNAQTTATVNPGVDDDAPVFDCTSLTTVMLTTEAPNCSNDTDVPVPSADDNCDGTVVATFVRSDGETDINAAWPIGTTTITWTFTDGANNVTECTQDVIVSDDDAPVFDCTSLTTVMLTTEAPNCSNDTDVPVPSADDNCDGTVVATFVRSDGETDINAAWPIGTTTITWTFTDGANNVTECTQDVIVSDDDAPVFDCTSLTTVMLTTEAPNCSNDTDVPVPSADDNCDGTVVATFVRSDRETDINAAWPLGTTTITWTFTDGANNVTECTQDVIVSDDDAPVFDCTSLTTVMLTTEAPNCSNDTDVPVPSADDNCDGTVVATFVRSDGETDINAAWPLGTTTITWTFTDGANNVTECTQDVIVSDDDAPVFDCTSLTTVMLTTEAPNCSNDTDVPVPSADDNCDGTVVATFVRSDGETDINAAWPLGTTTITWTFTDGANNVTECTQDVIVSDDDAPVFDCTSLTTVMLTTEAPNCSNDTDVPVPSADDNCDGTVVATFVRSDGETDINAAWPIGTTTITWTFTDGANNVTECTQDVIVSDDDAPVFDCTSLTTVMLTTEAPNCSNDTDVPVPSADDNCDGTVVATFVRSDGETDINAAWPLGTTTITWTFTDGANNVTECTQDVIVSDDDAPVFDCTSLTTVMLTTEAPNCSNDTDVPVPSADDNCDGTVVATFVRSDGETDINAAWPLGTTTITWTFTDGANNVTECTQDVIVSDDDAPVFDCTSLTTVMLATEAPNCSNDTDVPVPSADDNCDGTVVATFVRSDGETDINAAWPLGTTTITWTFTDGANNVTECTQDVIVSDDDAPVFDCTSLTTVMLTTEAPNCSNDTDVPVPSADDNCDGTVVATFVRSDGETDINAAWPIGTTTITWTFTDGANNVTECTQDVIVSDDDAPVFDCTSLTTVMLTTEAPNCSNDTDVPVPSADDNCDGTVVATFVRSDGETDINAAWPIGTTTITWTFTDGANNVTECTQDVIVSDDDDPIITCPSGITIECTDPTDPSFTGHATATDNCAVDNISSQDNIIPGSCEGEYTIERTWTATDPSGNSSSCLQIINVIDTQAPTLVCPADIITTPIQCGESLDPVFTGIATATDACDSDVSYNPDPLVDGDITYTDNRVDACEDGYYTIERTWTATDDCGNSTSCVQLIKVKTVIEHDCFDIQLADVSTDGTNTTYTWKICGNESDPKCNALSNIQFEMPCGMIAVTPGDSTIYSGNHNDYLVENPGVDARINKQGEYVCNKFYGIKFNTIGEGIKLDGECEVFVYTLPGNYTIPGDPLYGFNPRVLTKAGAGNPPPTPPISVEGCECEFDPNANRQAADGPALLEPTMNLYPNPANEQVLVSIENAEIVKGSEIQVINNLGQLVWTKHFDEDVEVSEWKINVSQWAEGVYYLQLRHADGTLTRRLLIDSK